MKKRTRKSTAAHSSSRRNRRAGRRRNWRELRNFIIVMVIAVSGIGTALAIYKNNYEISHDLSVIGQGIPVVVQIHDTNCGLCQQLRRNASAAAGRIGDRLLYRIADIATPEGRSLQRRHNVPHVTLLLFDGDGELRRVLNGVKGEALLHRSFVRHLERWGAPDPNQS